jgi:hypothetical protein
VGVKEVLAEVDEMLANHLKEGVSAQGRRPSAHSDNRPPRLAPSDPLIPSSEWKQALASRHEAISTLNPRDKNFQQ